MRDDERRALAEVRNEYRYFTELLRGQPEPLGSVGRNLEATYLIRLYAQFEESLRQRLPPLPDDDRTLVNCVQSLSGEAVGYDPADGGRALTWWRLFRRDRNLLAHGRGLRPSIGMDVTRGLMEEYLSRLKD